MPRPTPTRRPLSLPHPKRLAESDPAREEMLRRHEMAMALDQPGYKDPVNETLSLQLKNFPTLSAAALWSAGTAHLSDSCNNSC
jgi:hypothetical protein